MYSLQLMATTTKTTKNITMTTTTSNRAFSGNWSRSHLGQWVMAKSDLRQSQREAERERESNFGGNDKDKDGLTD